MLRDKILRLRSEKKITQQELADAIGVSRQTVKRWETGESDPSASVILPLCQYFGISPNDLLEGEITDEGKVKENMAVIQRTERQKKTWEVSKFIGYLILILITLFFARNWYIVTHLESYKWDSIIDPSMIEVKTVGSLLILLIYHFVMLKLDGKSLKKGESEFASPFVPSQMETEQLKKTRKARWIRNLSVYGAMAIALVALILWGEYEYYLPTEFEWQHNSVDLPVVLIMGLFVVFVYYFALDFYFNYRTWANRKDLQENNLILCERWKSGEAWGFAKKTGACLMVILLATLFDNSRNRFLFHSNWYHSYHEIYCIVAAALLVAFVVMIILLDRKLNRQK
ncbi:MAG: helix-turn-helix transcriptional regulator [Clostridia bacterium]|nr:helix-turn-helix transcriptional regulator [Clostridia bacterium]